MSERSVLTRWTPERARLASAKGRAVKAAKKAARLASSLELARALEDPLSILPTQLGRLVASLSAEIERCKAAGSPGKAESWIRCLERLVKLQRYVAQAPPARSQGPNANAQAPPPSIRPRPASPAGPPVPPAPPEQQDPIEHAPID